MSTIQAATLSVDINVDVAEAVKRLREMEQIGKQSAQALQSSLSSSFRNVASSTNQASSQVAQSLRRQQDEMIKTAQAEARLAAAGRDYTSAARILQQALSGVSERTRQVISAEAQLVRMQQYAAKETESLSRGMRILTSTAGALTNALGALGIGMGLQAAVQGAQQAMALANSIEQAEASLRAVAKTTQIADQAIRLASQNQALFGGTLAENISVMQNFVMLSQRTGASLQDLLKTSQLLSVVNPAEGLQGASFALSELLAGDITSIVERFNLPRQAIRQLVQEAQNGGDILAGVQQLLAQQGVTAETLSERLTTTAQTYVAFGAAVEQAQAKIGSFLSEALAPATLALTEMLNRFSGAPTMIDQVAQQIINSAGSYQEYVAAVQQANEKIIQYNRSGLVLAVDVLPQLTEAQYTYMQALLAQGMATEEALQKAQQFGLQMEINDDGVVTYTESSTALAEAKEYLAAITSHLAIAEDAQTVAQAEAERMARLQAETLSNVAAEKIKASIESERLTIAQKNLEQAIKQAAAASGDVAAAVQTIVAQYGLEEQTVSSLIDAYRQLEAARARAEQQQAINAARTAMIDERKAERERLYAQRALERQKEEEAQRAAQRAARRTSRGGGGGRAASPKVEQVTQEQKELERVQQQIVAQTERYEQRLLQIQQDYAQRAQIALLSFADAQVEGRAQFYDRLGQIQDQNLRQQLSAQYEAAMQEAASIAASLGGDVAEKYLQEQTRIILAQAERQKKIAEAEAEGKTDEAAYLRGVDELYRQAEQRKLEQIKSGQGSINEQQRLALQELEQQYQENTSSIVTKEEQKRQAILQTNEALREQARLVGATGAGSGASISGLPSVNTTPSVPAQPPSSPLFDMSVSVAVTKLEQALRDVQAAVERLRLTSPVTV
jgi:hypothetical protein